LQKTFLAALCRFRGLTCPTVNKSPTMGSLVSFSLSLSRCLTASLARTLSHSPCARSLSLALSLCSNLALSLSLSRFSCLLMDVLMMCSRLWFSVSLFLSLPPHSLVFSHSLTLSLSLAFSLSGSPACSLSRSLLSCSPTATKP